MSLIVGDVMLANDRSLMLSRRTGNLDFWRKGNGRLKRIEVALVELLDELLCSMLQGKRMATD